MTIVTTSETFFLQKYYLPENVGLPIGRGSDPAFFVLETHYDNPTLKQGMYLI